MNTTSSGVSGFSTFPVGWIHDEPTARFWLFVVIQSPENNSFPTRRLGTSAIPGFGTITWDRITVMILLISNNDDTVDPSHKLMSLKNTNLPTDHRCLCLFLWLSLLDRPVDLFVNAEISATDWTMACTRLRCVIPRWMWLMEMRTGSISIKFLDWLVPIQLRSCEASPMNERVAASSNYHILFKF